MIGPMADRGDGLAGPSDRAEPDDRIVANAVRSSLMPTSYPRIVASTARHVSGIAIARWELALRFVRRVQERSLMRILAHAKHTEIGRRWGFSSIRSYDDFVRSVPVGDYDSFSPYIQRMLAGSATFSYPNWFVTTAIRQEARITGARSFYRSPIGRYACSKPPGPTL